MSPLNEFRKPATPVYKTMCPQSEIRLSALRFCNTVRFCNVRVYYTEVKVCFACQASRILHSNEDLMLPWWDFRVVNWDDEFVILSFDRITNTR